MTTFLIDRLPMLALVAASALPFSAPASAAEELNLYTYREPALIKPLLDAFTKETGVTVNTVFAASGLEERLRSEGANSPADLLLTVDIGRLQQAKEYGITQPITVGGRWRRRSPPPTAIRKGTGSASRSAAASSTSRRTA